MNMQHEIMYPRMVHEHYVKKVRQAIERRDEEISVLSSRSDALRYIKNVKARIQECFGEFPEKQDLNAKVVNRIEKDCYQVENVIYESRPGYFVTANLYLPKGDGAFPAVVGSCGHSLAGKADTSYQAFCIRLVQSGFAVLIYDPISQGERNQYPDAKIDCWPGESCVNQHCMAGKLLWSLGESLASWFAWDGIRGIDYLCSRPEINKSKIGVTGNSGGGTLTAYINALDERVTMAAPSCYITSMQNNIENELATDSEQIIPSFLKNGLDIADLIIAASPRPTILCGQENDFFDVRGLRKSYSQIKKIYGLLDSEDEIQLHIGKGTHGYQIDAQHAMCEFFAEKCDLQYSSQKAVETLSADELKATDSGIGEIENNKYIHDLASEKVVTLKASRKKLGPNGLRSKVCELFLLDEKNNTPKYRALRPVFFDENHYGIAWPFAVETEKDIKVILELCLSDGKKQDYPCVPSVSKLDESVLYVPSISSHDDIQEQEILRKYDELFTVSLRGFGQSISCTGNDAAFLSPYGADYMNASYAQMFGESYVGKRVYDLLSVIELLASVGNKEIHLIGRGLGSITAAFAAMIDNRVKELTLLEHVSSFERLVERKAFEMPISMIPFGCLQYFDMEEIYASLNGVKVNIVS